MIAAHHPLYYLHPYTVPQACVERWWPAVRPFIERACRHNHRGESPENFHELLHEPGVILQVWIKEFKPVGCFVLELTPNRLHVAVVSFKRGELDPDQMLQSLNAFARSYGLAWISGEGRKGWGRMLARFGFEDLGEQRFRRAVQ